MSKLQTKQWIKRSFEIKAVQDDGSFEGYASVFLNLDNALDIVLRGAFTETLTKSGGAVPILWAHDPNEPLGFGESAIEDTKGLYVKGQINLELQKGREMHSMAKMAAKAGKSIGLSIGYVARDYDYTDSGIRELKAVDMVEYSLTLFPCNEEATIVSVKSIVESGEAPEISKKKRDIEYILKGAGCSQKEAKSAVAVIFDKRDAVEEETKTDDKAIVSQLEDLLATFKTT